MLLPDEPGRWQALLSAASLLAPFAQDRAEIPRGCLDCRRRSERGLASDERIPHNEVLCKYRLIEWQQQQDRLVGFEDRSENIPGEFRRGFQASSASRVP